MEIFDKNIPHSLLIHANLLNADYLGELAAMYQKHGYSFVSQEEVLKAPEYRTPITIYPKGGISWMFRWGISKGFGDDIMDNDVPAPEKIKQLAKQ